LQYKRTVLRSERAKRRNSISHFLKFYKIAYPHKQAHKSWMKVPNQCSQGVEQRARSSTPGEIQSHILWSVSPTYSLTIAQNSEQVEVNTRHDATPLLAPRPSRTSLTDVKLPKKNPQTTSAGRRPVINHMRVSSRSRRGSVIHHMRVSQTSGRRVAAGNLSFPLSVHSTTYIRIHRM
jgi:hypothetical protein